MVVDADAAMEAAHQRVKTATLQELIEQVTHLPAAILRTHQTLFSIFLSQGDAHRSTAILPGEGGHHNAHWKLRDSIQLRAKPAFSSTCMARKLMNWSYILARPDTLVCHLYCYA